MERKPKPFNRDDCLPELPEPRIRIFLAEEDSAHAKLPANSIPQEEEETPWGLSRIKE